jgi:outer membrane biogenesis lipoprotein LolB
MSASDGTPALLLLLLLLLLPAGVQGNSSPTNLSASVADLQPQWQQHRLDFT